MQSEIFTVTHIDKYLVFIPKEIYQPFADEKQSRVKVIATHQHKKIEFYAAVKNDKESGHFKMMFSKAKQKELNLSLGDDFEMQLFENTSKYGVDMPEELDAVLLSDFDAYQIFENLTKGKQRSIIYYILRLKNSQKRIDQSLLLCENLKRGNTENKELFKPL